MKFRLIMSSAVEEEMSRQFAVPVFSPMLWPADEPIPAQFIEVELDLVKAYFKTDGGGGAETPRSRQPAGEAT